jgi:glycosyltransferase involved in cell wall biosynthesis
VAAPRFSVVVPTRDRADTLRVALATCLDQDFDDYEVIVFDNASGPATRAVVDEAASPRIAYHRSETPLAMSDSWERAVGHARGDYVTVVGDDDALMPFALRELSGLIDRYGRPKAVHWDRAVYGWPTIKPETEANFLMLPLTRTVRSVPSRDQLARAARYEVNAATLPMIYTSVIRSDVIARHRQLVGRVFPTVYPDTYSGFAFAFLADPYLSVGVPMGVAGLSANSNGVATFFHGDQSPIAREFRELNREAGLRHHPTVPPLNLDPIHTDDSFQHARDRLFPGDEELVLDRRRMVERYLAAVPDEGAEERSKARTAIRDSLRDRPDLVEWFDREAPDPPPGPPYRLRPPLGLIDGPILVVDTSRFAISDVAEAARLASDILSLGPGEITYAVPAESTPALPPPSVVARVRQLGPRGTLVAFARRVRRVAGA